MIDLHTHTTASDGSMNPAEIIAHAKAAGLEAIAITDHDGVGSVKAAVAEGKRIGLEVIPGIELSVQSETETHIVGLMIDPDNPALLGAIDKILKSRMQRNIEYTAKLKDLGFDVSVEEARAVAGGGLIARAHYAKVMAMKGYTSSVKEAFDLYLGSGKPAYSNKQAITAEEGVSLIKGAGGMAYVAHLHLTRKTDDELRVFLAELKKIGLDGIEGWYSEYTPEMESRYIEIAASLDLGLSGGTDFHGAMKPHIAIGRGLGNMNIPYSVLENIKAARNAQAAGGSRG